MSGPIQTLPAGLLSGLQLKNMGRNPRELPDTLQSVMDLFQFYANDQCRQVAPTFNTWQLFVLGAGTGGLVPSAFPFFRTEANQVMYVRAWSLSMSGDSPPAATDFCDYTPCYWASDSGRLLPVTGPQRGHYQGGAGVTVQSDRATWEDFWMPPSCSLGVYVSQGSLAAGAMNVNGVVNAWKFDF